MRLHKNISLSIAIMAAATSLPLQSQTLGGCNVFPSDNVWNTPINNLPVSSKSSTYINTIGSSIGLHPDFSSSGGGIPYTVVPASQPRVAVSFYYTGENDPGPYPIPANAAIETGSDHHVLVLDQGNCNLYEMFDATLNVNGTWSAGSGAVFDLNSNILRPNGWTSSDAAGLPVLPGLVRYDEVMSGEIHHALRITAPQTLNQYIWPARHQASSLSGAQYPPLGARFRLKASFDVAPYPFEVQVIMNALKKYGVILADNGSSWYVSGAPNPGWNDSNLHALSAVVGNNMEMVDGSGLQVSANSGAVSGNPIALTGIYLDQREVSSNATVNAQVILTAPAPAGGAAVSVASSDSAAVSVPATVTVPSGAVSAIVPININSISNKTPVTLPSTYLSTTKASPILLVDGGGAPKPMLSALSSSATTIKGGTSITGSVALTSAAPAGGTAVALSSGSPSVLFVPAAVTVPPGTSSASFPITASSQTATSNGTVGATLNGQTLSISITITPSSSGPVTLNGLVLSSTTVYGGSNVTGTVNLTGSGPVGGATVSLSSSNPAAASGPSSITVPANSSSATFMVTTYKQSSNATASFTASLAGVSKSANLTITPNPVTPVSIFSANAVPGNTSAADPKAVELGMKFRSSVAGTVTGVRFYKGAGNTGTHTGHLWSANGSLLASVRFVNETASGWQQANFSNPVTIQPNTTYIVAYYAPRGNYADDENFFTSAIKNSLLTALQDGSYGPNSVYSYGTSSFPTQGWYASNYWVDVVFVQQ